MTPGQATRSIHGSTLKDAHGAPHLPIYNTTTFAFENTAALLDVVDGRTSGALYTRYGLNPTTFALEQTMGAVEGTDAALAFCSGMAAKTALFAQYGREGIVCLGHSDVTAGFLLGSPELVTPMWAWRKNLGTAIAPEPAALLARSLRTLTLRVQAQNASAQAIADAMEADPRVARVLYPGLKSFPGHELAAAQMSGFGGILTIDVAADGATTSQVADRLGLFSLAPSLGGAESLATQPTTTTHHGLSADERARRGITESMIRLSVGLEDTADLIADLRQALDAVS